MVTKVLKGFALAAAMSAAAITGAAAQSDLAAKAEAELAKYRAIPTFEAPGEPFDAKACMAGKRILSIPASSAVPFISTINAGMQKLAQEIGFEYQIWENQGQVSQWVQGLNHGASNKFDLIELLAGADPRSLEPQIKAAQEAGSLVVASHLTGFEQEKPPAVDGVVPIDYKTAGALLAWWTIAKTDGKTNAQVIVSNEALSTDSMVSGLKEVFDNNCPDCKYNIVNVPIPDWSSKIQPNVQSALLADPTINYVIPIYDSMAQFVVPALTITGKTDQVKIVTFNGTPFVIGMVQSGQVEMDVGENLDWIAHGVLDSHMRRLCGLPEVKDPKIPLLIFDKDNAASAGTPPEASTGYGDAYISGFRKLWKLQ
jgi:ribose transport system substrate-binding protein